MGVAAPGEEAWLNPNPTAQGSAEGGQREARASAGLRAPLGSAALCELRMASAGSRRSLQRAPAPGCLPQSHATQRAGPWPHGGRRGLGSGGHSRCSLCPGQRANGPLSPLPLPRFLYIYLKIYLFIAFFQPPSLAACWPHIQASLEAGAL